jgi:superfamily II DNA/RNA helicase
MKAISATISLQSIQKNLGIGEWNAMQLQTLQEYSEHTEHILLAPTGSGKTLAFLLPVFQFLLSNTSEKNPKVLVIAPTRELALQIQEVWKSMKTCIKSVCCYGGHSIQTEMNELQETPTLLIGTPGRLLDHLSGDYLDGSTITNLVIDEFDKVLEFGFLEEIEGIIAKLPSLQHKFLSSATPLENIPEVLAFSAPHTIEFLAETTPLQVQKYLVHSEEKDKIFALKNLLHYYIQGTAIVFVNHREAAQRIQELLAEDNMHSILYHGGLQQLERELAILKFKNGTTDLLIASDIASRGIDIDTIGNIIHYHFPASEDVYIHRNGRTARQEKKGNVFIIQHAEEQLPDFLELENFKRPMQINDFSRDWQSNWITLTVNAGKKNKINKIDIVGFLGNNAKLNKKDIGMIHVLDTVSFVAVDKEKYKDILAAIRNKKIKGKDYIFRVAK